MWMQTIIKIQWCDIDYDTVVMNIILEPKKGCGLLDVHSISMKCKENSHNFPLLKEICISEEWGNGANIFRANGKVVIKSFFDFCAMQRVEWFFRWISYD